ncbi:nose resistant to fluoxetine protein 6-like [Brevipalpus obovatus]|uniref:nose resistant to fluoxetine protein 6-like n=1 Tax=Brevipalpus obovatus TaxID=246614 RepID=UPI003D9E608E
MNKVLKTFIIVLILAIFSSGSHQVAGSSVSTDGDGDDVLGHNLNATFLNKWYDAEVKVKEFYSHLALQIILPTLKDAMIKAKASVVCTKSLEIMMQDVAKLKRWAIQALDSSGKLGLTGLMEGSVSYLGRYDECLQVDNKMDSNQSVDQPSIRIRGQYCSLIIRPILPPRPKFKTICNHLQIPEANFPDASMFKWLLRKAHYFYYVPMRVGLCSPSTCSPEEIFRISQELLKSIHLETELVGQTCDMDKDITPDLTQITIIGIFCAYIIFVLIATLVHLNFFDFIGKFSGNSMNRSEQDLTKVSGSSIAYSEDSLRSSSVQEELPLWAQTVNCFSIVKNAKSLLSMTRDGKKSSEENLSHIHGIRVLTMAWIILGHTFGLVNHSNYTQSFNSENLYTNIIFQALLNATVCVDTFFVLSGLLSFYVTWKKINSGWKLDPIKYISLRFIRLTPAYSAMIALAIIFPLFAQGPLWKETTLPVSENCYSSWWTNILYINNLIKTDKICLMHSWYLSNDFQFHILGLICLGLFMRSAALGFISILFIAIFSTALSATQVALNNYPPTIVSTSPATPERWQFILDFYYKPWPHLPSYCVGMIFGYLLSHNSKVKLNLMGKTLLVIFSSITTPIAVYGVDPWNKGQDVNLIASSLYASTFRTLWSMNCGLFIFFLAQKKKSMIFKALSWDGLIPISRLTFMAYLVHPFVIWYYYGTTREPITGSPYPMFHNFLAFYLLTYVISFIVGVLFECPCISLVKMLLEPKSPHPLKTDLDQINDTSTTKLFSGTAKMPLENPCLYLKKI